MSHSFPPGINLYRCERLSLLEKRKNVMEEHQYILGQTADVSERVRLSLLEQRLDAQSRRYVTALGTQKGWRCLEVGAGHGSIVRWLAAQVGPEGRVVATDINPRFLTEIALPNVEARQHDI